MTQQEEIVRLCDRLLRDFEYPLVSIELILNHAHHLAEVARWEPFRLFFEWETAGYPSPGGGLEDEFLKLTSRWDEAKNRCITTPAAIIEQAIETGEREASKIETQMAFAPSEQMSDLRRSAASLHMAVQQARKILHHVRRITFQFAATLRAETIFSQESASIFGQYQSAVDTLIAEIAVDALEELPSMFEQLGQGGEDATSHVLVNCRRMIEAVADAVFPPSGQPILVAGEPFDCSPGQTENQLTAFIQNSVQSKDRRHRMTTNLGALWAQISKVDRRDVTPPEARALVLRTYLLLREIAQLRG